MTVVPKAPVDITDDPLLPWLRSIEKALNKLNSSENNVSDLDKLIASCIHTFKNDVRYRDDFRFLKIWFLYIDGSSEFESIFNEMQQYNICLYHSLLYESYALFLEAKGMFEEALVVYNLGISRNAEPVERLKKAQNLFYQRMKEIVDACSNQKIDSSALAESGKSFINPWSATTIKDLLQKMKAHISKYEGYYPSCKVYPGKVALSSLQKSARNKVIDIGGMKYQIKGCAGQGGFAQVFKAYINSNPEEVVALKIQKPPFPWEFYMYRQLDKRILEKERRSFGFAHSLHLYSDYSILVSDYLSHGTLQDAINSNVVTGGCMDEVLCIYYTIEMLSMLKSLHSCDIIHGDFKPDNLLIRYARDDLTVKEDDFHSRTGPWSDQGLCLVDWGRGIDLSLFPDKTKFTGDCRTSGFRCIEMQESKPWRFQVDLYGLCVIVHMMLHNSYMEIEKRPSSDDGYAYQPKATFKRYWQIDLWKNLFLKLLNVSPDDDHIKLLQNLIESFQDYVCSKLQRIKDLKQSLVKQRSSLCSA